MGQAEVLPDNESDRLRAVRRYDVLDTPPDGAFERITRMAARLFDVPIAIVSIVDSERIWFKSHYGLDVDEIGREPGLCASAILQDEPWLISDARHDPRALSNPLVAGEFGLQFYAGVPLHTHDGYNLGTLCVIDRQPRQVSDGEAATLTDLAGVVMDELELRLSARRSIAMESELRRRAEQVASTLQESLIPPGLPAVDGVDLVARYHVAHADRVGGDFYDVVAGPGTTGLCIGDVCGKGTSAAALAGSARWTLHTLLAEGVDPARALSQLNSVVATAQENRSYLTAAAARLRRQGTAVEIEVACGGHPSPVVVHPDARVSTLRAAGPIVGWFPDSQYTATSARLDPGDVVLLFTDGLLEAISHHDSDSAEQLKHLLSPVAGKEIEVIADHLDGLLGSDRQDDVAFLLARIT